MPVKFSLHGDLGSWRARLQPFVPLTGWSISGAIDANGSARVSAQQAELGQTSVQISQLAALRLVKGTDDVVRETVAIREPVIKIETSGSLDRAKSKLELGSTTFASSTVAFRADGLRATLGKEPSLVGAMDLRADLSKLQSWFPGGSPPSSRLEGAAEGHLDIGYRGQVLVANWSAKLDELKYLDDSASSTSPAGRTTFAAAQQTPAAWRTIWHEPRVTLDGQGTFDQAAGSLKVDRCTLAATSATVGLTGKVTKLTAGTPEVDLSGDISYDLADVTRQIQENVRQPDGSAPPMSLNTLQLVGKEKRPFTLKGPLFAPASSVIPAQSAAGGSTDVTQRGLISAALVGDASLRWEGAAVCRSCRRPG